MRHLLVVAYHFPPAGGVPVRRVLRFLRHLPEHGFRCSVLTADRPYDPYHPDDPEGLARIPPVERVLRAPAQAGAERALAGAWRALGRLRGGRAEEAEAGPARPAAEAGGAGAAAAGSDAVAAGPQPAGQGVPSGQAAGGGLRRFVGDHLLFPDPKRAWARAAERLAARLARDDPFDAVLATGYPWSSFLAGIRIGEAAGVPVALDYRDAWTANPRRVWDTPKQRALEADLVRRASLVVAATDWIRDDLRRRFRAGGPVETITNGYDLAEWPEDDPALREPGRVVLTYTGSFNDALPPSPADQSPWYLLQALRGLEPREQARLRVRLVGRIPASIRTLVRTWGLEDVVEVLGPVSHARALQHQRAADVLLVIVSMAAGSEGILTGKLVEYVGARRPILLLGPLDGAAANAVVRLGVGRVRDGGDVGGITQGLRECLQGLQQGGATAVGAAARELSAEFQCGRLARLIDATAVRRMPAQRGTG